MFPQPTKATRSRRGDGDMLGEGSGGIAGVAGESNAVVSVFPHSIANRQESSQFCLPRKYHTFWLKNTGGSLVAVQSRFHHWRRGGVNASVPRNDTKAEADGPHSPTLRRLRGANKR
jgi:hypothetical protein